MQVQSEMIDKYRGHMIKPKNENETLEKDLRSHHFNFGNNTTNFVTQAKDDYKNR